MYSVLTRKTFGLPICVIAVAFLLSACGILPEEEETLASPLIQPKRQEYQVAKAVKKDITKYVKGTGYLEPENQAQLFFKESGRRIASIDVKYGENVEKGAIVARLDQDGLESKIRLQQIKLDKVGMELDRLKKQLSLYMSMQPDLRPAANDLDNLQFEIDLKKLDYQSEQIIMDDLKRAFDQAVLRAPFTGKVIFIESINEGDIIDAYKTIMTIADVSSYNVYYQSENARQVKTGMKAEVTVGENKLEGAVTLSPDNTPINASEKFKDAIIISVPNLPKDVSLGDSVDISVPVESRENTIVIPKRGLNRLFGSVFVRVLEGDILKELNVEVGIETYDEVEIKSGLNEGQMVILY